MRGKGKRNRLGYLFVLIIGSLFLLMAYFLIRDFLQSLFFNRKERVNIVFYKAKTYYYSLDRKGEINYYLYLPPDLKTVVPGGYGIYRLGGLGKLSSLEKKPSLFKKTFSLMTGSFVDYYFYPKKVNIYYGFDEKNNLFLPSLELFNLRSNAGFFDRLYLFYFFLKTPSKNYLPLPLVYDGKKVFDERQFFKDTQGYFYKKRLREEDLNIQIIFHQSYKSALSISSIIEGEGIRVNDLAQKEKNNNNCLILENRKKNSETALALKNFFRCQIKMGETNPYDIILILNSEEDNWLY